jgi:hypothetical protein
VQEVAATGRLSSPIPRPSGHNLDSVGSSWLSLWLWDVNSSRIVSKDRPRLDPREAHKNTQHAERRLRLQAYEWPASTPNWPLLHAEESEDGNALVWCSRAVVLSHCHLSCTYMVALDFRLWLIVERAGLCVEAGS